MMIVKAQNIKVSYDRATIIDDLSVSFLPGKINVIIGPNGCGKSTLLKALSGVLALEHGEVLLADKPLLALNPKSRAKTLSLLPQYNVAPDGISVLELVKRGRFAYQNWMRQWHPDDEAAVCQALSYTGLDSIAHEPLQTLSGGQRQRAWLALVLAQQTPIVLLDEPTTYLDMGHQIEVLNVCKRLNEKQNSTIIMVLHDLNLAARYADFMVAMKEGKLLATGRPEEVITANNIQALFDLSCQIIRDPASQTPLIIPDFN
ncbi:ABC transporter ATP-binding protein [Leucothrix sargassi]|nr:ABC transporter ATP-binding protein [Leucothrix sargassi]